MTEHDRELLEARVLYHFDWQVSRLALEANERLEALKRAPIIPDVRLS